VLTHVLCAVDSSDVSEKVFRHAAGLASVARARLAIVHVHDGNEDMLAERVRAAYLAALPYGGNFQTDPPIMVATGEPATMILAAAADSGADLLVCGTRARGAVAAWLLGSTSRRLLEKARVPLLLIPDDDRDVVTPEVGGTRVHFGSVIAAVDRTEFNPRQLRLASEFAGLAHQPLALLTVIEPGDGTTIEDATSSLRDRGHGLTPSRPHALIVRRGHVADEIVHACQSESAGLVVMGLRSAGRGGRPGVIASAVLSRGRAAVLAVPHVE
jgi:nucleotide-binding universal stress UspA family protein